MLQRLSASGIRRIHEFEKYFPHTFRCFHNSFVVGSMQDAVSKRDNSLSPAGAAPLGLGKTMKKCSQLHIVPDARSQVLLRECDSCDTL